MMHKLVNIIMRLLGKLNMHTTRKVPLACYVDQKCRTRVNIEFSNIIGSYKSSPGQTLIVVHVSYRWCKLDLE